MNEGGDDSNKDKSKKQEIKEKLIQQVLNEIKLCE